MRRINIARNLACEQSPECYVYTYEKTIFPFPLPLTFPFPYSKATSNLGMVESRQQLHQLFLEFIEANECVYFPGANKITLTHTLAQQKRTLQENSYLSTGTQRLIFPSKLGLISCEYSRTRVYRTLKGNRNWFDIVAVRYI